MGDVEASLKTITRAINMNSNISKYYLVRCKLYLRANSLRRAVLDIDKLITLEKTNAGLGILQEDYMREMNNKYQRDLGSAATKVKSLLEGLCSLERALTSSYDTGIKFKLKETKRLRKKSRETFLTILI